MLGAQEVVAMAGAAVNQPAEMVSDNQAVVLKLANVPKEPL